MHRAFDVAEIRRAESALMARVPLGALMERAAAGLVSAVVDVLGGAYGARVVLLVGSGDNGGDALLAGALLARRGARVDAVLLSESVHEHVHRLRREGGRTIDATERPRVAQVVERADVVVDGNVGIGGTGGLRSTAAEIVASIPSRALIVAVDIPSGVDADTGVVPGAAVRADLTVCMGALKPGLLIDPGAASAGAITVVDIHLDSELGAPVVEALDDDDVEEMTGGRLRDADKYASGVVGIVAGSVSYPGAAVLAVAGAIHGGAGYVRFVGHAAVVEVVRAAYPEVVATTLEIDEEWNEALERAGRVQAWVAGPGSGTNEPARDMVAAVLDRPEPVLLDADALTCLAEDAALVESVRVRAGRTVLTPHAGELARLLGEERSDVEARRLASVERAADALQATVLLKGSTTLVADPLAGDQRPPVRVNLTGTPALATAGSGDVLSGLIGALLARGMAPRNAASVGAHVHGNAGQGVTTDTGSHVPASAIADALDTEDG